MAKAKAKKSDWNFQKGHNYSCNLDEHLENGSCFRVWYILSQNYNHFFLYAASFPTTKDRIGDFFISKRPMRGDAVEAHLRSILGNMAKRIKWEVTSL